MAALGVSLHNLCFALGKDDGIAIMEAPDDESAVAGSMAIGTSEAFFSGALTNPMLAADTVTTMQKANSAVAS